MNEDISSQTDSVISSNGIHPNGISLNGIHPNGIHPNGISVNGIHPNGIDARGAAVGVVGTGTPLSGPGAVGSTWTADLSDGTTATIRIDAATQLTGANSDVWSYRMSVRADGAFQPLCLDPAGNPIDADTVSGTWNLAQGVAGGGAYTPNNSLFTVACRGSAIAKCVEFGYKPWKGVTAELAACVRALRGDYCGNGTPYTVTGTLVNIFDARGIQTDDADWTPEAAWTPNGATCVSKKKASRFDQVANERPACYPHSIKPQKSCGTAFDAGAVIITELPPQ